MKKLSIIIPAYNNPRELRLTLDSIANQTFPLANLEVIVADDGSNVDMRSVGEEYTDRLTVRYFWQEDKGFCPGTARNMGISVAEGELCVFLDSGVIVTNNCLPEYYRLYKQYGENLCIIGYVLGNDTSSDLEEMRQIIDAYSPDEAASIMYKRNMLDGREKKYRALGENLSLWLAPYTVLWSLHFAVPTAFLKKTGVLFDEHFNAWGGEDSDFGIQLFYHGAKYILARNAVAIHYPAQVRSYDKLQNDLVFREKWLENKRYLARKYAADELVQLWLREGTRAANSHKLVVEKNSLKEKS